LPHFHSGDVEEITLALTTRREFNTLITILFVGALAPVGTLGRSHAEANPPVPTAASQAAPVADDLALILRRLKAQYGAGGYSHAPKWLSSQEADGHWADVAYEDPLMARWKPLEHLGRLGEMANAYANPSSPTYHSPAML